MLTCDDSRLVVKLFVVWRKALEHVSNGDAMPGAWSAPSAESSFFHAGSIRSYYTVALLRLVFFLAMYMDIGSTPRTCRGKPRQGSSI